jgi:hypothetical protein
MLAVSVLFTNGFKTFQSDEYDNYKLAGLITSLDEMVRIRNIDPRDGHKLVINTRILNISRSLFNENKCVFEQII